MHIPLIRPILLDRNCIQQTLLTGKNVDYWGLMLVFVE
jgi:hypothetical protein